MKGMERTAYMIAAGCALQVAESIFPHPVPGVRLGLAGAVTLAGLSMFGFREGLKIAVFRPVVSSFVLGSFMSPGFIMSFAGSVVSYFVMALAYRLKGRFFSNIGVSISGAAAHNVTQLLAAYVLFVRHSMIFSFIPLLLLGAAAAGWFTGYCVNYVVTPVSREPADEPDIPAEPADEPVPGGVLRAAVKILVCMSAMILLLFLPGLRSLVYFMPAAAVIGAVFGISAGRFFAGLRILWVLLLSSVVIHVFFTPGDALYSFYFLRVSGQGLVNGVSSALRIIYFLFLGGVLVRGTPWGALASGIGGKAGGYAVLVTRAMAFYPVIWRRIQDTRPRTLHSMLDSVLRRPLHSAGAGRTNGKNAY